MKLKNYFCPFKADLSKFVFLLLFFGFSFTGKSQTFDCYLTNDTFISSKIYQFDLYLLSTGPDVFEYAQCQWGIAISSACASGGALTAGMVPGSSELTATQVPVAFQVSNAFYFNIAAKAPPGCGLGTIVSNDNSTGCSHPGTRVGTFTITNTADFFCTCLNLTFNFVAGPGKTRTGIFACVNNVNTDVTDSGTFYSYDVIGTCLKPCDTGTDDFFSENNISIYPNPSTGSIRIISAKNISQGEVTVFSMLGEKVYSGKFNGKQKTIEGLSASGIYFVQVKNGNEVWMEKIIRE